MNHSKLAHSIIFPLKKESSGKRYFRSLQDSSGCERASGANGSCTNFNENEGITETDCCSQKQMCENYLKIGITEHSNMVCILCFDIKLTHKWQFYDHFRRFLCKCMFIFHKTEVQTVILICLMGLNSDWFKSYGTKCK